MSTIPINTIINVEPSVLSAGGNPAAMDALVLTKNVVLTSGGAPSVFYDAASVAVIFTAGSDEAKIADQYFAAFDTATQKPKKLLFFRPVTVAGAMDAVTALTTDFFSVLTAFVATSQEMEDLSDWFGTCDGKFAFICADADATAAQNPGTFAGLGKYLVTNTISGVALVRNMLEAAFVAGSIAATDYARKNGRITLAFKSASSLAASVSDATSAANLLANGYNYYGAYATAATPFNIFYNGQISGDSKWIDSYAGAAWLNRSLELAIASLFVQMNAVPYTNYGYSLIKAACQDSIDAALNAGVIVPGVILSNAQKAEINAMAGLPIDSQVQRKGYYLQILDPGVAVRALRGSPVCTLWYADGGSVQKLTLASISIQ